ncbi:MAG: hypothetical protein ACOYEA_01630 [Fermentimonas sp.]|jgi:hypothetical protein
MLNLTLLQKIRSNSSFGLIPFLVFTFIVSNVEPRISVLIALIISIFGSLTHRKHSKLLFDVSTLTFTISFALSFTSIEYIPFFNKYVVVESIFLFVLVVMTMFKKRIMGPVKRENNSIDKNYYKESFKVARQTQYVLIFHVILILLYLVTDARDTFSFGSTFILLLLQLSIVSIIVIHTSKLYVLEKTLYKEEWLPVVNENGDVRGRVAKSITKGLKNRFMHPVVRVALMHEGSFYLKEREPSRLLNPGKLDYPFEKYMEFREDIDCAVKESLKEECGEVNVPLRFTLKYTFENDVTKRLIFLYVAEVDNESAFDKLQLNGGKLWTPAQIEDNLSSGIFSECFELEYEYLKNTVLLAHQYKKKKLENCN